MNDRRITAAELALLEEQLPKELTPAMHDVVQCLFEALVLKNTWGVPLLDCAHMAMAQLQTLADTMGGEALYLAKGVTVHLSARDRKMCTEFRGDYKVLARKYNLTEMRVRQIVDRFQREQFLNRQQGLPGLD
jgi:Mor family transcriptional regulator